MNIDIKKIARLSLAFIAVGLILAMISVILQLLTFLLTDSNKEIVQYIVSIFSFISFPLFFLLFAFAGYRSVKIHHLDLLSAGLVSAFSYVCVALIHIMLNFFLATLVISGFIPGGAGFGSFESAAASSIFGSLTGPIGLGIQLFCGFGIILIGSLINFVVGGIGGLVGSK